MGLQQNGYLILEVPPDAKEFSIWVGQYNLQSVEKGREYLSYYNSKRLGRYKLPRPGNWQIICKGNEASEEVAKEIVEWQERKIFNGKVHVMVKGYKDYERIGGSSFFWVKKTAIESLHSLIRSHKMQPENTLILFNKNK